jgi:predicted DNA-binding protein
MAKKKVATTVYLTTEQKEKLHLLHQQTQVPISVYIRRGIDMVLAKNEHLLPGQLTLLDHMAKGARKPE